MNTALTSSQKRYLRALGHALKPVIQVGGKGISAGLVVETANALALHELIKVKVAAPDRGARDQLVDAIAVASGALLVSRIGNIALLYRPRAEPPRIALPH